jgi:hypothetical protein
MGCEGCWQVVQDYYETGCFGEQLRRCSETERLGTRTGGKKRKTDEVAWRLSNAGTWEMDEYQNNQDSRMGSWVAGSLRVCSEDFK